MIDTTQYREGNGSIGSCPSFRSFRRNSLFLAALNTSLLGGAKVQVTGHRSGHRSGHRLRATGHRSGHRSQVTGQATGHRPQIRSQVTKNNRTLDKTVLD